MNKCIKKVLAIVLTFVLLFSIASIENVYAAGGSNIAVPTSIINVNTTITDTVSQGGCWANLVFRIEGSYECTYVYGAYELMYTNLTVEIESKPTDWTVVVDSVEYELNNTSLTAYINYHFRSSYYDCAYTGGYVYTTVQGTL